MNLKYFLTKLARTTKTVLIYISYHKYILIVRLFKQLLIEITNIFSNKNNFVVF